jgi:hypothetical protein
MNLLSETREDIRRSGHTVDQVTFIGSEDGEYSCTWAEFEELADREYDDGYGAAEVATDLIVRFSDGRHMWRAEYDGKEWWDYDNPTDVDYKQQGKPIKVLIGDLWRSLNELNTGHQPSPDSEPRG